MPFIGSQLKGKVMWHSICFYNFGCNISNCPHGSLVHGLIRQLGILPPPPRDLAHLYSLSQSLSCPPPPQLLLLLSQKAVWLFKPEAVKQWGGNAINPNIEAPVHLIPAGPPRHRISHQRPKDWGRERERERERVEGVRKGRGWEV